MTYLDAALWVRQHTRFGSGVSPDLARRNSRLDQRCFPLIANWIVREDDHRRAVLREKAMVRVQNLTQECPTESLDGLALSAQFIEHQVRQDWFWLT